MLSIKQILEIMHSGAVFSLKVVRYDKRRKDKTGHVLEIAEGKLVWGDGGSDRVAKPPSGERAPTALERQLSGLDQEDRRNPNHKFHYTRNVRILVNGQFTECIEKIHPPLIIEFNGQPTTA